MAAAEDVQCLPNPLGQFGGGLHSVQAVQNLHQKGAPLAMGQGQGGCNQVKQTLVEQHVSIAGAISSWSKCNDN